MFVTVAAKIPMAGIWLLQRARNLNGRQQR